MQEQIRNRIKGHRRVRAGELVPHELNFRLHPDLQRSAIQALYKDVGFARSLLAYELPDGRLKLIDGHLRRDIDPNMEVEVEILDVNEEEARTLLLSIDPLAALAESQESLHERLREVAPTPPPELLAAWQAEADAALSKVARPKGKFERDGAKPFEISEQFMLVITCRDEKHQVELLERFQGEGFECKALVG